MLKLPKKQKREDIAVDGKKTLSMYIKPGIAGEIFAILFVIGAVVCLVMGMMVGAENTADAVAFDPISEQSGEYVYLDLVGISDWVAQYDGQTYYTAVDQEGYMYTVRLDGSDFKKLTQQRTYWDEETAPAVNVRLYGTSAKPDFEVVDLMCQGWEMTRAEYGQYFGDLYFNGVVTPAGSQRSSWLAGVFICAILAFALWIGNVPANSAYKRSIRRLEELGQLERAAEQLESENRMTIGKDMGRLTDQYIFGKKTGAAIRYEDVVWCYKRVSRVYFIAVNAFLVIHTIDGEIMLAINFGKKDKFEEIENCLRRVFEKNPNALIGYNQENQKAYKEKVKAAKL